MNLSKQELIQLRKMVSDVDAFDAIENFANSLISGWQNENVIGDSEFDTLKLVFMREAKIMALIEFIKKLEELE